MDEDQVDARTVRCGKTPPTADEKDKILSKSRITRIDFCRLNNCADDDYMIVELIARSCLGTVVDVQLEKPIEGVAEPGDEIKLYMLLGGSRELKTLWKKVSGPFDVKMRKRFPDYFKHVDAAIDSTKKSHHPGDEDRDIVVLTNSERDTLLHRVWTREAEYFKGNSDGTSPTKKRRRVGQNAPTHKKSLKTARQPNVPRLWNNVLWIREVTPAAITNEEVKTAKCYPIAFSKFCDDSDYTAVSSHQKPDLDTALFSCRKLCELINKSGEFNLQTGCVSLTKARRRCDRTGRDSKRKWSFQNHTEHKAEYYLEKMLEQWVAEAALDPNCTFELSFRENAVWEGVDMPVW